MLEDQVIVVTGAAGRIGSALARAIVNHGGSVVLVDIVADRLAALAQDLGPNRALPVVIDSSKPSEIDSMILQALERFGRLDAAVHSAYPRSAGWGAAFEALQPEYLAEDLYRHLGGAILFSQRVLEHFKRQGHGNLIHVASIQGVSTPKFEHYEGTTMVSPIEYTAIKAGLIAVTRYLAKYYMGHHIRVNCVSPGGILDGQPESFQIRYRHSCNEKGLLDAGDLAGAFLFLLSRHSACVTGQNLVVDDGWTL